MMQLFGENSQDKIQMLLMKRFLSRAKIKANTKGCNVKPHQDHAVHTLFSHINHTMNRKDTGILLIFRCISTKIWPKLNFKIFVRSQLDPSDTCRYRWAQKRRCSYSFPMHSPVCAVFHTALYISNIFLLGFPALGK